MWNTPSAELEPTEAGQSFKEWTPVKLFPDTGTSEIPKMYSFAQVSGAIHSDRNSASSLKHSGNLPNKASMNY